jgi:hypothetical protein
MGKRLDTLPHIFACRLYIPPSSGVDDYGTTPASLCVSSPPQLQLQSLLPFPLQLCCIRCLCFIMSAPQDMSHRICQDITQFRHFSVDTNCYQYAIPASLPQRPAKFNNLGRECPLTLNTFNVLQSPSTVVHQYDVSSAASSNLSDHTEGF